MSTKSNTTSQESEGNQEIRPKAKLRFITHSCIHLTSVDGIKIIIDPFISNSPTCPSDINLETFKELDFIILTHGHTDHTNDAIPLAKLSGAKVIATYELSNLISRYSDNEVETIQMNKGGTLLLPGTSISISLTHAYHSSSFDSPDGQTHYAGEACGVILTLENGKSIYHAGDTCYFSEMKYLREKYAPEIAFLPIGDCFTMGPREAALSAQTLGINTAVPIHWGTFPPLTGTPEDFQQECQKLGIKVSVLNPGNEIEIS